MGGGLEADLSQGAVPALWSVPQAALEWPWRRLRPVLQVADVWHELNGSGTSPARTPRFRRYRLLLSDGVHSQHALLVPTLHHVASDGALRRGSIVRVVQFVHLRDRDHVRTMLIVRLEILQTECALIGSLKLYEQPRNSGQCRNPPTP